jgi:hypothetical protein
MATIFLFQKKILILQQIKNRTMTRIILKSSIDTMQMSVLMGLFDSWNVNVEIVDEKMPEKKSFSQLFSKTRGIWQDYDIDGAKLRNEAWGINEKATP